MAILVIILNWPRLKYVITSKNTFCFGLQTQCIKKLNEIFTNIKKKQIRRENIDHKSNATTFNYLRIF